MDLLESAIELCRQISEHREAHKDTQELFADIKARIRSLHPALQRFLDSKREITPKIRATLARLIAALQIAAKTVTKYDNYRGIRRWVLAYSYHSLITDMISAVAQANRDLELDLDLEITQLVSMGEQQTELILLFQQLLLTSQSANPVERENSIAQLAKRANCDAELIRKQLTTEQDIQSKLKAAKEKDEEAVHVIQKANRDILDTLIYHLLESVTATSVAGFWSYACAADIKRLPWEQCKSLIFEYFKIREVLTTLPADFVVTFEECLKRNLDSNEDGWVDEADWSKFIAAFGVGNQFVSNLSVSMDSMSEKVEKERKALELQKRILLLDSFDQKSKRPSLVTYNPVFITPQPPLTFLDHKQANETRTALTMVLIGGPLIKKLNRPSLEVPINADRLTGGRPDNRRAKKGRVGPTQKAWTEPFSDRTVDRYHFRFHYDEWQDCWFVSDGGSTFGTFLKIDTVCGATSPPASQLDSSVKWPCIILKDNMLIALSPKTVLKFRIVSSSSTLQPQLLVQLFGKKIKGQGPWTIGTQGGTIGSMGTALKTPSADKSIASEHCQITHDSNTNSFHLHVLVAAGAWIRLSEPGQVSSNHKLNHDGIMRVGSTLMQVKLSSVPCSWARKQSIDGGMVDIDLGRSSFLPTEEDTFLLSKSLTQTSNGRYCCTRVEECSIQ
eukprot:GILK01007507.1.p1 GENE.GILK01007507.1~~GILK01007507.1.p1  ORF type:complete len:683 (+),score=121.30 GILK01007507.1:29-2050(+)